MITGWINDHWLDELPRRYGSHPNRYLTVNDNSLTLDDMRDLFRKEVKPRLAKYEEVGSYNQEI